jgi:hypothetical protein
MGNDLETERLLFYAGNGILAIRQRKPIEDKSADFYWITLFFFEVLFWGGFAKVRKIFVQTSKKHNFTPKESING